jgi:8-oxo-dGTP pyrophosphatase MutT (NUDIX family)
MLSMNLIRSTAVRFGQKLENDPRRDESDLIKPPPDHQVLYRDPSNWKHFAVARKKPDPVTGRVYWHYAYRPCTDTFVGVIPTILKPDAQGKLIEHVVFLETQRDTGKAERCIDLVAGDVDNKHGTKGLDALNTAHRELAEEAQLISKQMKAVPGNPIIPTSPGCIREFVSYYLARYAQPLQQKVSGDADEAHVIRGHHVVPVNTVMAWLTSQAKQGKAIANNVYAGVLFLLNDMRLISQK